MTWGDAEKSKLTWAQLAAALPRYQLREPGEDAARIALPPFEVDEGMMP